MATKGSTNLNRILRVTAHLLFERGQSVNEIHNLMQGFVDQGMLAKWYQAYRENTPLPIEDEAKARRRRMPLPPIDWDAITLQKLEEKTQSNLDWF
jgi:hypothetical protein